MILFENADFELNYLNGKFKFKCVCSPISFIYMRCLLNYPNDRPVRAQILFQGLPGKCPIMDFAFIWLESFINVNRDARFLKLNNIIDVSSDSRKRRYNRYTEIALALVVKRSCNFAIKYCKYNPFEIYFTILTTFFCSIAYILLAFKINT